MGRAIETLLKYDIRMDGMQAIFSESIHPTQSHVKVHSMSILKGPRDKYLGNTGPPFATLKILVMQEMTKWRLGKGGKNQQHRNLIVNFNNIH